MLDGFSVMGGIWFFDGVGNKVLNLDVQIGFASEVSIVAGIRFEGQELGLLRNNFVHNLMNNTSTGTNAAAIQLIGSSYDNVIERNTTDTTGSSVNIGLGTKGAPEANPPPARNIWRYNLVLNSPTGIHLKGNTQQTQEHREAIIYQNIFVGCNSPIEFNNASQAHLIYNNTMYDFGAPVSSGKDTTCPVFGIEFFNNVMQSSGQSDDALYNWRNKDSEPCGGNLDWSFYFTYADYNNIFLARVCELRCAGKTPAPERAGTLWRCGDLARILFLESPLT